MREIFERLREWWREKTYWSEPVVLAPPTPDPVTIGDVERVMAWAAPIGTPLPVDDTTPWDAVGDGWVDIGYVDDIDVEYDPDPTPVRDPLRAPPLTWEQTVAFENWPWDVMDNIDITDTSWVKPTEDDFEDYTDFFQREVWPVLKEATEKAIDNAVLYGRDVHGNPLTSYHNPEPHDHTDHMHIRAYDITKYKDKPKEKQVSTEKPTKVQVTFNRVFTYAEREAFRDFLSGGVTDTTFKWIGDKKHANRVVLESSVDSRDLVADVSEIVEEKFLNVYPVAAKTIRPKVVV